ncbi:hypothetical protein GCM10010319_22000 [Streptomyces blastmyceticus]|uniref:Uncharacterized protein n=1 Tax=Streptomyces blastmyceticus TaxID=68180 RepID=A0ABN0WS59_9ACTN
MQPQLVVVQSARRRDSAHPTVRPGLGTGDTHGHTSWLTARFFPLRGALNGAGEASNLRATAPWHRPVGGKRLLRATGPVAGRRLAHGLRIACVFLAHDPGIKSSPVKGCQGRSLSVRVRF